MYSNKKNSNGFLFHILFFYISHLFFFFYASPIDSFPLVVEFVFVLSHILFFISHIFFMSRIFFWFNYSPTTSPIDSFPPVLQTVAGLFFVCFILFIHQLKNQLKKLFFCSKIRLQINGHRLVLKMKEHTRCYTVQDKKIW